MAEAALATVRPVQVVIVGGCGRVGLPLGLAFAEPASASPCSTSTPRPSSRSAPGRCPSTSTVPTTLLTAVVADGTLDATTDPACVAEAEHVIVVIGTPVDEHLNPEPEAVPDAVERCSPPPPRRPAPRAAQHRCTPA